jgi:hypothetical protein
LTISNPKPLSSSETRVNPGIKRHKSTYMNEQDVRKPLVASISQRSEDYFNHSGEQGTRKIGRAVDEYS